MKGYSGNGLSGSQGVKDGSLKQDMPLHSLSVIIRVGGNWPVQITEGKVCLNAIKIEQVH